MTQPASPVYRATYKSPIGRIEITANETEILSLEFVKGRTSAKTTAPSPALKACLEQLDEYFAGKRKVFELMLRLEGTAFQCDVWQALLDVPYGTTVAYADVAKAVNKPKAVRAVGSANGANPISIVVPCHRVVASNGGLGGYGGGLWRKEWLIQHEWKYRPSPHR